MAPSQIVDAGRARQVFFVALAVATLLPWVSAPVGLLLGVAFGLTLGNPLRAATKRWTSRLLQGCVVGLGAGMNLATVVAAGVRGFGYTLVSIAATLAAGALLARALRLPARTAALLSSGTAICGGSAIAAVAPVVGAQDDEVSVSLATVFLLNAAALLVFPPLGHLLGLTPEIFGVVAALAIHDTSSVVGAGAAYGGGALEVATTVKLARALWIVPLAFAVGVLATRRGWNRGASGTARPARPWFILGFIGAAALATALPALAPLAQGVAAVARRGLVLTLFLIGSGLTRETLQQVGVRPFLHGVVLWMLVIAGTLGAATIGWLG